jgi:hypothetical protein
MLEDLLQDWIEDWRGWVVFGVTALILVTAILFRRRRPKKKSKAAGPRSRSTAKAPNRATAPRAEDRPLEERLQWSGAGGAINAGGFLTRVRLESRLVFAVRPRPRGQRCSEPAAIDGSLPLSSRGKARKAPPFPRDPHYHGLSPSQRRAWLEWLATGPGSYPSDPGHLDLYLRGLERRALEEEQDVGSIALEIVRVLSLREKGTPLSGLGVHAATLVAYLAARSHDRVAPEVVERLVATWKDPDPHGTTLLLSWAASRRLPLPGWLAFGVAPGLAESRRGEAARKTPHHLSALFSRRYEEELGTGLLLRAAKRPKRLELRPLNPSLRVATFPGDNPLGAPAQLRPLSELWNRCLDDLRRFALIEPVEETKTLTPRSWATLPRSLRRTIPHPAAPALHQALRASDAGATRLVPFRTILELLGMLPTGRLPLPGCREVASLLEDCGHLIEPDPRLTSRPLEASQTVAVFPRGDEEPDAEASRVRAASHVLELGHGILAADGPPAERQLSLLLQDIEKVFGLTTRECRRLEARAVLIRHPAGSRVESLLEERPLEKEAARRTGRLLVALAAHDGVVTDGEEAALQSAFDRLGLGGHQLARLVQDVLPAPEATPDPEAAETSPPSATTASPPERPETLVLDRAAIARILDESRDAARIIAGALAPREESDPLTTAPAATLPLLRDLVARTRIPRDEAAESLRNRGLMLDGTVAAINEWSCDALGGPLVYEEEDELVVERELLERG